MYLLWNESCLCSEEKKKKEDNGNQMKRRESCWKNWEQGQTKDGEGAKGVGLNTKIEQYI